MKGLVIRKQIHTRKEEEIPAVKYAADTVFSPITPPRAKNTRSMSQNIDLKTFSSKLTKFTSICLKIIGVSAITETSVAGVEGLQFSCAGNGNTFSEITAKAPSSNQTFCGSKVSEVFLGWGSRVSAASEQRRSYWKVQDCFESVIWLNV